MHSQSLLSASVALFGAASAVITGIAAPSEIAPGSTFPITILTGENDAAVTDVVAAFGLNGANGGLGTFLSSTHLGAGKWLRVGIKSRQC